MIPVYHRYDGVDLLVTSYYTSGYEFILVNQTMPNARYQTGRSKEYAAKHTLERMGYHVTRSSASKGLADLVGVRADDAVMVQVKYTSAEVFYEDENCKELRDLPVPFVVRKELWVYRNGAGLCEVRDLKQPKPENRSELGRRLQIQAMQRAAEIRALPMPLTV